MWISRDNWERIEFLLEKAERALDLSVLLMEEKIVENCKKSNNPLPFHLLTKPRRPRYI
jgi:hypothetical protein